MTWNLKRSLILGAVLLVGIVTWWQVRAAPAPSTASPEIETFQLTTDPEEVILVVKTWGGMSLDQQTRVLLGDGTLYQARGSKGKAREGWERSKTLQLDYVEMEEIVRIAVDGGLIELDWEALQAKIREKYEGVRTMTDSPHIRIEISLAGAQTADGEELGPISSTFSCVCVPALLAEAHPDVPEVQALLSLIGTLTGRFYPDKVQR